MADKEPSLRDSIASALDDTPSTPSTPAASPSAPSTPSVSDAPPAAPGATAAAATSAPPTGAAGGAPAPTPAATNADGTQAAPVAPKMRPPADFPDVRVWDGMPDEARRYIKDTERRINNEMQRASGEIKFGRAIVQELRPYEALFSSLNLNPVQAVREMGRLIYTLSAGTAQQKVDAFRGAAQHYGVPLDALATGDGGTAGTQGPPAYMEHVQRLEQTVRALAGRLQGDDQRRAQEVGGKLWGAVDTFAGRADREHFPLVYEEMARMIQSGMFGDDPGPEALDEAYELACYRRKDLRALSDEKRYADQARQAQAARAASTATGGAPVAANVEGSDMSLRSTIENLYGGARL